MLFSSTFFSTHLNDCSDHIHNFSLQTDRLEEVMKVDHLTCEEEVEAMQISDPIQENIHGPDIPRFYKTNITPTGMTETSISYREPETLHQRKAEAEDSLPTGRVVGENEG